MQTLKKKNLKKNFCLQKVEKTTPKSSILKQKFRRFRNFPFTAKQPKWQNSCFQMWPIEQLYIELGSNMNQTLIGENGSVCTSKLELYGRIVFKGTKPK